MALPKLSLNEGSLLRRTLLHVATFVVGAVAFVSVMSLVLVSVARGLVPHAPDRDAANTTADDGSSKSGQVAGTLGAKPGINKKKVLPSTTAERPKEE